MIPKRWHGEIPEGLQEIIKAAVKDFLDL